jgi:hypothetical protein
MVPLPGAPVRRRLGHVISLDRTWCVIDSPAIAAPWLSLHCGRGRRV